MKNNKYIVAKSGPRCWEIIDKETNTVSARLYSWNHDDQQAQAELESLSARFLDTASLIKDIRLSAEIEIVNFRLMLFALLIKFAAWVGGFGGMDFFSNEGAKITEINK